MSNGLHVPRLEKMKNYAGSGALDLTLLVIMVPLTVLAVCGLAVWVLCDKLLGGLRALRSRER